MDTKNQASPTNLRLSNSEKMSAQTLLLGTVEGNLQRFGCLNEEAASTNGFAYPNVTYEPTNMAHGTPN